MKQLLALLLLPSLAFAAEASFIWDANTEPDMSHYNGYATKRGEDNFQSCFQYPHPTTEGTCSNLEDGTEYTFRIYAVDTSGNQSLPTDLDFETADQTAPAPVQGLRLKP